MTVKLLHWPQAPSVYYMLDTWYTVMLMFILLSLTQIDTGVKLAHSVVHRMLVTVVLCTRVCFICVLTVWASINKLFGVYLRPTFIRDSAFIIFTGCYVVLAS